MNKYYTQAISKLFFLIVITFSSSCEQSTNIVSPKSTSTQTALIPSPSILDPIVATLTLTAFPCAPTNQQPTTEFEKRAEEWFHLNKPEILTRDNYNPEIIGWIREYYCGEYQEAILEGKDWIHSPIEVAMRSLDAPSEGFSPDIVKALFNNPKREMATVIVLRNNLYDDSIKDQEWRIDVIKLNGIWNIQWSGYRQRCRRTGSDEWVAKRCL